MFSIKILYILANSMMKFFKNPWIPEVFDHVDNEYLINMLIKLCRYSGFFVYTLVCYVINRFLHDKTHYMIDWLLRATSIYPQNKISRAIINLHCSKKILKRVNEKNHFHNIIRSDQKGKKVWSQVLH